MKGKHAAAAAGRRESAAVSTEIEAYRHNVRRLTSEVAELREALESSRAAHLADVRNLKAQLNEGLSPELLALRSQLERAKAVAESRQRDVRHIRLNWDRAAERMQRHFRTAHALDNLAAFEAVVAIVGAPPEGGEPVPEDQPAHVYRDDIERRMGVEAATRLRAARRNGQTRGNA